MIDVALALLTAPFPLTLLVLLTGAVAYVAHLERNHP